MSQRQKHDLIQKDVWQIPSSTCCTLSLLHSHVMLHSHVHHALFNACVALSCTFCTIMNMWHSHVHVAPSHVALHHTMHSHVHVALPCTHCTLSCCTHMCMLQSLKMLHSLIMCTLTFGTLTCCPATCCTLMYSLHSRLHMTLSHVALSYTCCTPYSVGHWLTHPWKSD